MVLSEAEELIGHNLDVRKPSLDEYPSAKVPGKVRQSSYGKCKAPKGYECNQQWHQGRGCTTRPCSHCSAGCMYYEGRSS